MAGAGNDRYTNIRDMIDGGGAGASGLDFHGPFGPILGELGIRPLGYKEAHAADMEREQQLAEARARSYRTATPPPAPTPPGMTTGMPIDTPVMPPATRMGVGPDNFQYASQPALPALTPAPLTGPAGMSAPPVAQPAAPNPRDERDAEVRAFEAWMQQDPTRWGMYLQMPPAAQIQRFRDWQRGVRF